MTASFCYCIAILRGTSETWYPQAEGREGSERITACAGQSTSAVIELGGDSRRTRLGVLEIVCRVVGAAIGILEEHWQVGIQTAASKAVVGRDLRTNVRTTDRNHIHIGGDHRATDPVIGQTGGRQTGQPVALGSQRLDGVRHSAGQVAIQVIILDGNSGCGSTHVLNIESRIIGTAAKGILEQHRDIGGC